MGWSRRHGGGGETVPVAKGERSGAASRLRARAENAVVPFPRSRRGGRHELARFAPSGRSLALGLLVISVAAGCWFAARTTSLFAVDTIEIHGARASVGRDVRAALETSEGRSLLAVDVAGLESRLEAIPSVAEASIDRAFPHTLDVDVVAERPAAVLRQGADSWLTSERGRVIRSLPRGTRPELPRVWLGRGTAPQVGAILGGDPGAAVRAVAPLVGESLPVRIASVRATRDELTLVTRGGLEVRLGDGSQLGLKLAVAARILPSLVDVAGYLDVAVPERPVAADTLDSQVEVETATSTGG